MLKCDPCRDCGDCPPPKFKKWITDCLLSVKICHEMANDAIPRRPDRLWLKEVQGVYPSTVDKCVRWGLLADDGGLVLTSKGLAFLEGE